MTLHSSKKIALALAAVAGLGLAACSSDNQKPSSDTNAATEAKTPESGSATTSASSEATSDKKLEFSEGYVGAKGTEMDMTAAFGKLMNHTDKDIHITKASGSLKATYQLHQVVNGVMSEDPDGFVIPANGEFELKPGGNHIMIMNYPQEIAAGDSVELTLTDDKGGEYKLGSVPVRVQQSNHEHYGDSMSNMNGTEMNMSGSNMPGMDHSEHQH
ncbi:copper chaperone PCu(A)C [Corynebacterium heidelbergense]|uniref:Copper chaperone PCu(A)C n=1 Tax=Corynebacterium heidelbergense TaxID=2055947 RepID=A0A364V7S8_9CORY|nr:copper chaperone PCu(A)C [Corynebacterium heidelbergense]RAV32720.1 copper chaperone PCu(A)C [Corynebacterium heidelbergense]